MFLNNSTKRNCDNTLRKKKIFCRCENPLKKIVKKIYCNDSLNLYIEIIYKICYYS